MNPGGRVRPCIFGGSGIQFTLGQTPGGNSSVNFASEGGAGLEFMLSQRTAIEVDRFFRHYSNADIHRPDQGVDCDGWWVMYTRYLDR